MTEEPSTLVRWLYLRLVTADPDEAKAVWREAGRYRVKDDLKEIVNQAVE